MYMKITGQWDVLVLWLMSRGWTPWTAVTDLTPAQGQLSGLCHNTPLQGSGLAWALVCFEDLAHVHCLCMISELLHQIGSVFIETELYKKGKSREAKSGL